MITDKNHSSMTETPTHLFYRGGSIPVTHATDTHLFFRAFGADRRIFRAALAATGSVRLEDIDLTVHLSPPPVPAPSLAQLRRAAADAHPDRGGSAAAFMAAHAAYLTAKGRAAA